MRCNIPNGLSWSFRVIGPNLINPGLHSWKKCKQPTHKYSMPLQATIHLFTCSCRKNTCLAMTKLHFIVFIVYENATKKYTHQSLTCCFIEWLAQPPNIHFGLQHWIFPIFARQHLCFGLFMSTCIKLVCFTYVTC